MRFRILACLFLACPLAHADWQYTKWGMTMAEVQEAASKAGAPLEVVKDAAARKQGFRFKGAHKAGKFLFKTRFLADENDRLEIVQLVLVSRADCGDLRAELDALYGKPTTDEGRAAEWWDQKSGNRVLWSASHDAGGVRYPCTMQYRSTKPKTAGRL
jgi:hypothetical protein